MTCTKKKHAIESTLGALNHQTDAEQRAPRQPPPKKKKLVPGDLIELAAGVVIPSDGKLVGHGEPMLIDESSLTGESLPVTKRPGDEVLSGAVVVQGELEMMVTATGVDTFFGKTIALLATVTEQGNVQVRVARHYQRRRKNLSDAPAFLVPGTHSFPAPSGDCG